MEWAVIIGLIAAGLILLVLEVLVIPGVGVVGFFGFALIVFSLYSAFAEHGTTAGVITTIATFFASVLVVWFSLRSKTWKKISLNTDITSRVNIVEENEIHVGDQGITSGRIAPMGKAMFNGKYFEVKSGGAFIDPDKTIQVARIDGNQIYVKEINQQ
ncbi:MAG: NfeD family protein [Bacteroidales bacterium]